MKTLIKQFFLLTISISGVCNFQAMPETVSDTIINWADTIKYGGYISRPLLKGLECIFGNSVMAIKIMTVLGGLGVLVRFFYSFNIKLRLPNLPKITIEQYEKPQRKEQKPVITKEISVSSDTDLRKKVSLATEQTHPLEKEQKSDETGIKNSNRGSLLKDFLSNVGKDSPTLSNPLITKEKEVKPLKKIEFSWDKPTFPYSLLESNLWKSSPIDQNFIVEKAKALQKKLLEFGIPVSIEGFDIGPAIVQIRIKPAEGIKISAIENLANDVKLSLKSKSLSIIAPIPWTDCVGIQIPNPKPSMVRIGDVLNSEEFQESMKKKTTWLALGKGVDGKTEIKALEDMPHLLIAWATGSWKSVGVNDFIVSLMFQNSPSELKFLMVDPKQVELEMYSWLPYMLAPIVFDSTKAIKLLQRAVEEMERRYTLLKENKVKNLAEYNEKAEEKMYKIVFIIDEMADMMMSSAANRKEVDNCVNRLAAKARAAGIYLILATQRPSVNVITGTIKANIPTRIAFGVVSEVDSRTILGRKGAEELVGKWDMLYMDQNTKFPIRIQAPFISTEEIDKIVTSLKNKYMKDLTEEDIYNPEILRALEDKPEMAWNSMSGWGDDDELVEQAIGIIMETRKASATLLQRKLWVGFARAARIMDILEEKGIIGPQEWARPREILI